jgi:ABC transporter substrate binding protein
MFMPATGSNERLGGWVALPASTPAHISFQRVIETAAPKLDLQPISLPVHDGADQNRDLIIVLTARHRLPAIYPFRYFAVDGGLISYGIDPVEQWRGAAGYVARILNGEKPGDLPVQALNKYEMVINPRTAKAIGLDLPPLMLNRADKVIE